MLYGISVSFTHRFQSAVLNGLSVVYTYRLLSYSAAWSQCSLHIQIPVSCAIILCCMVSVFSTHMDCCQLCCHTVPYSISVLYTYRFLQAVLSYCAVWYQCSLHIWIPASCAVILCCMVSVFSTHMDFCKLCCHIVVYGISVLYTY